MRWLILCCIALLAVVGNAAIFERFSILRAGGGLTFNLFVVSLVLIWRNAYFASESRRARGLALGHALLVMVASLALILMGAEIVATDSCESLMRERRPNSWRNQLMSSITAWGYCREVGWAILALGVYLCLPSLRLFRRTLRDARNTH